MAKGSGWANWKARYGNRRGRDTVPLETNRAGFAAFAENSKGPVQKAVWDQDLVDYNDNAEIEVKRENVSSAAKQIVEDSKDASLPKDYLVKSYQEAAAQRGERLTAKQAENAINREQSARAKAVLAAAQAGKVRLTPAQERRLEKISQGSYLDLVYGQYKSGDNGTLIGVRKRGPIEKRNDSLEKAQKRQEFMQFLAESRGYKAA